MRVTHLALTAACLSPLCGCAVDPARFKYLEDDCVELEGRPACGPTQLVPSEVCSVPCYVPVDPGTLSPMAIDESMLSGDRVMPLSLQECINLALSNSTILRDLGGAVLRAPELVESRLDPARAYTDPVFGEEAALSAFDANLFASNIYEKNDRRLNNRFFGDQGRFQQDLNVTQVGVGKRSATGGLFTLRNVTTYDRNNQSGNLFEPDSSDTYVEGEVRQPLLQGAGTQFNRIAGPGAAPGQLQGVLLARVRSDISLLEFEQSIRDVVADTENAYWDLYYAYRDLEARIDVRDIAEDTLRLQPPEATSTGKIAQAEEQVYRFQADIVDSLNGRPLDATRTNNGSQPGTFRGFGGLRYSERRLRLIAGLPINDGTLIKPSDSPFLGPVIYDWSACVPEALTRRPEIRRQKWVVKQRELELIGNRNFFKPQLDLISRYRVRGFGQNLTGPDSAIDSLFDSQFQEWQFGVEASVPVGLRRAHAAVQNSRLSLVRETELLREQERYVIFGLSNAVAECKRAFENMNLQRLRLDAIVKQLNAIAAADENFERAELDVRLETHRRLLDARLRYHQSEVEHALALRNVNYEKGTLLEYCNVRLDEAMADPAAYADAADRREDMDYDAAPKVRDQIIGRPLQRP